MFEGKINKIILFCIFLSIFVSSLILFKTPVEFYIGYLLFIILLPIFFEKFGLPKWSIIFLFLFAFGVFNILLGNDTIALFMKIFLGMFLSYLFYFYVIANYNYQIETLFKYYLKGAYIVSIIGLFQFVSFQVGFVPGYNFHWILNKWGLITGGNFGIRVNSIFPEPTYFATFISSAFFIAVFDLFISKKPFYYTKTKAFLIIFVYLLTFSGIGYYCLILTFLVLLINYGFIRYLIIALPIIFVIFKIAYNNVPEFQNRLDSTIDIFSTGQFSIGITHGSSIVLYNNYHIATENFKTNFLFGSGLGSHPLAAEKFSLTKDIETIGFQLNYADANSMLLRILSEMGLFGIFLTIWILFKCYLRKPHGDLDSSHWIISNALFVLILLNLFRQGHYFLNGFPFYVWLYIYNYFDYKKFLRANSEQNLEGEPIIIADKPETK